MTIDEAITIIKGLAGMNKVTLLTNDKKALELGVEALKHVKDIRVFSLSENPPLLPGETQ
jgi:hypothetical protein